LGSFEIEAWPFQPKRENDSPANSGEASEARLFLFLLNPLRASPRPCLNLPPDCLRDSGRYETQGSCFLVLEFERMFPIDITPLESADRPPLAREDAGALGQVGPSGWLEHRRDNSVEKPPATSRRSRAGDLSSLKNRNKIYAQSPSATTHRSLRHWPLPRCKDCRAFCARRDAVPRQPANRTTN
jgi:hypothetical protein